MPIVNIQWTVQKTALEKKELMEFICKTICEKTGTEEKFIYVYINDNKKENVRIDAPHVMINWVAGDARTPEAKQKIAAELSEKLAEMTGAEMEKIVVIYNDVPPHSGVVGGVPRG